MNGDRAREIVNTYRLQLHAGFTFDDARRLLPYLAGLGITHLYLSPITTAARGSTHGYDVVDPTRLGPQFGGDEDYRMLVQEQRRLGLGQVVDVVPNHMGIAAGVGNAYWEDVLRHGRSSACARLFDIDWDPPDPDLHGRVLLPILGAPLEEVIAGGELELQVDDGQGWLRYYDHRLPLSPESLGAWQSSGNPLDPAAIRAVLDLQHYRLEYWQTGKPRVNYRRFFAIDELIGVRVEDPEVFDLAHDLVLRLLRDRAIDGVRIDHPDGLFDPQGYLDRLRGSFTTAGAPGAYAVLEKILAIDELLSVDWRCDGTTGYEFMNEVVRVLVDAGTEERFTAIYRALGSGASRYEEIEDRCRSDVIAGPLSMQFDVLARRLHAASGADVAEDAMIEAVQALLPRVTVYRTYHREQALDPVAEVVFATALERARAMSGADPRALEVTARLLAAPPEGEARRIVMQLQQIMPAVQAKGLEDRAFYRYRRLLALNEVGGDPGTFGQAVEVYHERLARDALAWPRRMLTTATHDHKRGEDVRMRLAALSELPGAWEQALTAGLEALAPVRRTLEREVHPDDLYLLFQTLIGCAPAGMETGHADRLNLEERVQAYMLKALREAGERTDWIDGDAEYERAVATLVTHAVGGRALLEVQPISALIERVAHLGAVNSLAQVVLKVAGPGVADTYQGNELWDLSLVDPDNRRPVSFALRHRILDTLHPALDDGQAGDAARADLLPRLAAGWRDGRIKMFVLARGLRVRRERPALFLGGAYEPLAISGERARHAIAFARRHAGDAALAVVPRLPGGLLGEAPDDLWSPAWGDTALRLSPDLAAISWHDAFTGRRIEPADAFPLASVLGSFPVALLLPDRSP